MTAIKIQRAPCVNSLLDVREVAEITRMSTRTIQRLADRGLMPPPVKLGALVRWPRMAIESWIERGCKPVISSRPRPSSSRGAIA